MLIYYFTKFFLKKNQFCVIFEFEIFVELKKNSN